MSSFEQDKARAIAIFDRFTKEVAQPAMDRVLDDVADVRKAFGGTTREIEALGEVDVVVTDPDQELALVESNSGVHLLFLCVIQEAKRAGVSPEDVHTMFHDVMKANLETEEEHEARKANAS
jgi:chorismate mutase